MRTFSKNKGFTLIETIIAIGIFMVVSLGIYFAYSNILDIVSASQLNLVAISAADNEFEIVRNMPYQDVGTIGGAPAGKLQSQKTIKSGGVPFLIKTFVRNTDDPFDGTVGGAPNDTAPADYKIVELQITCPTCARFPQLNIATTVAPPNLESTTNNGSLFINVFNSSGIPISNATVQVTNNLVNPAINLTDITNNNGVLQLVDIATSSAGYVVRVSNSGYSSDQTYPPNGPGNPNPVKPNATVAKQQLTSISFAIDRVSQINLATTDQMCKPVPSIDYSLSGNKLIGTNPNVLKYSTSSLTDVNGLKTVSNLEWDNYDIQSIDTDYDLAGTSSSSPMTINPNTSRNISWVMMPKNPDALLVTVQDQTGKWINDASVRLTKAGYDQTIFSGQRTFGQTNWSGNQYNSQTGNIDDSNPAGDLTLRSVGGKYATSSEELVSSTFDLGTSNTTFYSVAWNPTGQSAGTTLNFQVATNNDNQTWNFIGPDGTSGTRYTTSNTQLYSGHNGNRYLRYKVFMSTTNNQVTPRLQDISFNFHSSCGLDGQAFFNGLSAATYTVTIQKAGFQTLTNANLVINKNWQIYKAVISP